ncbi:hypothetical protein ACIA8O_01060 [Kitasatospora sp. NPDC051853]|uniref:hypothetical protein n=1 Tax=Kitasatospora sp. NPDC051853 TaxID=3364058 RepID=UPI00379B29CF
MPSSLPESWLHGIAVNPAAPADVLLRLLTAPEAGEARMTLCGEGHLPPEVWEAARHHPDFRVRRHLGRNRNLPPEQRGLLADDPSAMVRAWMATGPRDWVWPRTPLPEEVVVKLMTARTDPDDLLTADEIASQLPFSRQIPDSYHRKLPTHPNPKLRLQATWNWQSLTEDQRAALRTDPDPTIRAAAQRGDRQYDPAATEADLPEQDCHARVDLLLHHALPQSVIDRCLAEQRDLRLLAHNPHTPADVVTRLARDPDRAVRLAVAQRLDATTDVLALLADDPDEEVRAHAAVRPLFQARPDRSPRRWPSDPVSPELAAWYRTCATSPHLLARQAAASSPALPPELVPLLAADPDPTVRHRIAEYQGTAPAATVLETFITRPDLRDTLQLTDRLPRTGLAHLLDHEDPGVRALAATDPTLPEPPVPLLDDPSPEVRRAAATNPLLPAPVLSPLLHDPDLARSAAANPSLTGPHLHALLDAAGLPHP